MGYYLETPKNTDKVEQIRDLMGGEIIPAPPDFSSPKDRCLVCVIHVYGAYDAAMVIDEERQFIRNFFPHELAAGTRLASDDRPRTWMLVPWDKVAENLGFDPRKERGPSWVR